MLEIQNAKEHSSASFDFEYQNIPLKKAKKDQKHAGRKIVANKLDLKLPHNGISTSKYNVITFLPKNIFEQFSKIANIYFLIIGIMQSIKEISISGGTPDIFVPLFVIFVITAIKDLYEDIKRHRSDSEENNKICNIINPTTFTLEQMKWHECRVGHIIKIAKDEYVPADMVLLLSSDPKGQAFIETKNLDGETNLKHKTCPKSLIKAFKGQAKDGEFQSKSRAILEFEAPNPYLYIFNGSAITETGEKIPLDNNNFVLRGCSVRNTDWVYGLITYTGSESKIMLNSVKPRTKRSKVESLMSIQIVIIFIFQILLCIFCAIWYSAWFQQNDDELSYLDIPDDTKDTRFSYNFGTRFGTWMLIFSNFVPISLLVTLEMVKFLQGTVITKDKYMFHYATNSPTVVQTSNLNEELGQIEHIFSDKTGTLTQNYMEFKKLIAGGTPYGEKSDMKDISKFPDVTNVNFKDSSFFDALKKNDAAVDHYLISLAVCHTIITETKGNEIIYNASSPDELALVNFAKFAGCEYIGLDDENHMEISFKGKPHRYKLLQVLEFNSKRKRMSVLVENEKGEVLLYCKGADSIILERMNKDKNPSIDKTMGILGEFADEGLRTLLIAYKVMSKETYQNWAKRYLEAATAAEKRHEKMEVLQDDIETDLILIGATAIEDKLQDEVGSTIDFLKRTGIKVWVLTGDKIETAINIGFSCKLLTNELKRIIIDGKGKTEVEASLTEAKKEVEHRKAEYFATSKKGSQDIKNFSTHLQLALIVSGDALIEAMKDELSKELMDIADHCEVVICCRVAPKQKADVVTLVRKTKPKVSTLAIGDGANDVNMITAAHVGVGIRGVEGQQAARASDYAFGEFKFLKRLLCYHGRESYRRNSNLILYNFFKNVLLVLPVFWLGFSMIFSGQNIYDTWLYSLFNVFYASLPIVLYALFDKQYTNKNKCLMDWPALYVPGIKSMHFNVKRFWLWFINAVVQSVIVGTFCLRALETNFVTDEGYTVDLWITGTMIFGLVVVIVNFKILTFSYTNNVLTLSILLLSFLIYLLSLAVVNFIVSSDVYQKFGELWRIPNLYFGCLEIIMATTFLDLAIERYFHLMEVRDFRQMVKAGNKANYESRANEIQVKKEDVAKPANKQQDIPINAESERKPIVRRQSSQAENYHGGYAFSQEDQYNWFNNTRKGVDHPQN